MVIAIKHKPKPKEDKNSRHAFFRQIYERYSIPTNKKTILSGNKQDSCNFAA